MNRQHFVFPKSIRLHVANETMETRKILVKWQIRNAKAQILREEENIVVVSPMSGQWLEKVKLPEINVFCEYVSYEAWEAGEKISEGTTIFSYPKYFRYEDPKLSFSINNDEITVTANAYAKSVEIQNENQDLVLSDNYFDLNSNSRTVKILRGNSTGIRVGELVRLNISDIDFEERECVVYGKGDKERRVYFDAKAKLHLQNYIKSRTDDTPALFVTLDAPYDRLKISGVEIRMRELGRMLNIPKIHPHKFRRTMATRAIDKGMPIEQAQKILGHSQIDTTMQYAIVNQNNVKASHRRYIA